MSFPNIEHDVEEHWDVHLAVPITAPEASALVFYCNNSSQNYEKGKCYLLPCALAISQFRCVIGVCNTYEVISIPFMSIAKWKVSRATHHVINELQSLIASSSSSLSSQSSSTNTNNYANRDYSSCAYVLTLHTKHVFTYHILLQHEMIVRNIKSMLNRYASIACVQEMPAFEYCRSKVKLQNNHVYNKEKRQVDSSSETDYTVEHKSNGKTLTDELEILMATEEFGWNIYSPEVEYARQLNGLFMLSSHPETLSEEHQEEEEKEDNEDNEKEVLERMMEENAIDVISVTNTDRKEDERDKVKSHCDVRHKFHFISLYNNSSPTNEEIRQIPESFSPSYPPYVLTPRSITLPQIIADLTARSRGRVLNVSFVHGVNGALLIRAAQPLLRSSNIYVDAMMCREFMKREYTTILYNHSNKNCIEVKGNTVTHVNHTSTSSLNTSKQHLASQPPPSLFDDDDDDDDNSGSKQMQEYSNDNANGNKVVNVHEQESQNNSNINITKNSTPAESHIIKKASQEQILQEKSQNKSNAAGVENNSNATTMDSNSGSVNNHRKDKMTAASTLFVADCRPSLAANANAQLGGGFESGTFYNFARLFFYNIDNIFAMKKSLVKIRELIREYAVESDKEDFYKDLHSSK